MSSVNSKPMTKKKFKKEILSSIPQNFTSKCVRNRTNWAKPNKKLNLVDNVDGSLDLFQEDYKKYSPKLDSLLKKINYLDERDMKNDGKLYKHFIFTDIKSSAYGAKNIASGLISKGYTLGYKADPIKGIKSKKFHKIELFTEKELQKTEYNNFYLLTSISIFDQPINAGLKKHLLDNFNQRPDNNQGKNIRFIIMDSGYKEGIDLFDIKYIHIFEPPLTMADQKQVIGRGTRTCGQKGLDFDSHFGWPLHVFIYDMSIPEPLQFAYNSSNTTFDLFLKSLNIDPKLYVFAEELEKVAIHGSVDYDLNKNIHEFKINKPDSISLSVRSRTTQGGNSNNESYDKTPNKKLSYDGLREYIKTNFANFAWDSVKLENGCVQKGGLKPDLIKYTPTQDFVRNYFTPQSINKGILLWHSVGTGKTCSAIAAATSTFEPADYTILWVTRTTLKSDIWKNMFKQVCNEQIKKRIIEEDLIIPDDLKKQFKLLSKSWKIKPISYKQFSNLIEKKNNYYERLVKINGDIDPLRKTLIIIDEAHKLYGASDLSTIEKPDMVKLRNALMHSYEISGDNSVKLMLMTATPITENPMELIQLVNLCKPIGEQMPSGFYDFSEKYLNKEGLFTKHGKELFLNDIAGYISYLNRENDARQFAQPIIKKNMTNLINLEKVLNADKKLVRQIHNEIVNDIKKTINGETVILKDLNDKTTNRFKDVLKICNDPELNLDQYRGLKRKCLTMGRKKIRHVIDRIKNLISDKQNSIKELKKLLENEKIHKKEKLEELSEVLKADDNVTSEYKATVFYQLKYRCGEKIEDNDELKKYLQEVPAITKLDNEISANNEKIKELQDKMNIEIKVQQSKMKELRNIIKKLPKNDVKTKKLKQDLDRMKIKIQILRSNAAQNIKGINYNNNQISKTRKKRVKETKSQIRKTLKNQAKNEKQGEKMEKKILKGLRKLDSHKEEFKLNLHKDLIKDAQHEVKNDIQVFIDSAKEKMEIKANKIQIKEDKAKERELKKIQKAQEKEAKILAKVLAQENKIREKEEKRLQKEFLTAKKTKLPSMRKTRKIRKLKLVEVI